MILFSVIELARNARQPLRAIFFGVGSMSEYKARHNRVG